MYKNDMYCTSIWSRSLPGVATRILIPFLILKRHTGPHAFKRKFTYIYSVFRYWCSVHTVSEKFQDAALFLNLKRSVSKTLFKPEKFENADFLGDEITINRVISLTEFSSNTNPKWPVIFAFSNSSDEVWMKNIWCVFRVEWNLRFQILPA